MNNHLSSVVHRFLRYVQIDTQSDPGSDTVPSTEKQKDLSRLLVEELKAMGIADAGMDESGYVYARLAGIPREGRQSDVTLGLLAHLDTSPDASGKDVKPIIHSNYQGEILRLPGDPSVTLDPARQPALLDHIGHDIITSDGTTLLGSDDKAGVAILMQLAEDLLENSSPRPPVSLCFTVDEEIGRGVDHIDLDRFGADVAYTIDGSGTGAVFAETFNAVKATLRVEGVMVHPGYAKGIMVNAVRILSEMIAALPAAQAPESTDGREGYIHPHVLSQGDASTAESILILRDFSDPGMEAKKEYLRSLTRFFQVRYPKAEITVDFEDQYRNMRSYIEDKDPRVISIAFQAADRMGLALQEHVIRGGTDGARLSELGIPTPNVFNGGHDYHSRFEWNSVQNLELSLEYVKHVVHQWALAKKG